MKKITLLLLLFVSTAFYAQTSGITYQAIIYNPNGEVIPGNNNANSPLANKNICLQFTIVDSASLVEYKEKITVSTDEYGMVNTVIGTGIQTGGYATSFANVNWSLASKSLKVAIDTFGLCSNFIEISNQLFTSVPYAFAANSADNVTGVVQILHGGTGATTVIGAKTNLGLENVDNTRDINKPISIATQAALNLKEDLANKSTSVTADGASNTKYSSVKAIKDYVDTALSNEASIRAAADLLKEDLVNKSTNVTTDGTSNTKYPSVKAVKDYVDVSINLGGTALTNEANIRAAADVTLTNNLAAEITNRINSNLLKEDLVNKSTNVTTDAASNTKYPSVKAVKDYVDVSINLGGTALTNEANIRAAADVALNNNLALEISNRTNADLLKEDVINKSTNVNTDANSNTKYPSVLAIKTYVDGANSALTTALNAETAARIAGDNTLTTNLAAEVTRATTVDNTLTSNLLSELIRASGAENTLTTNLATEVTNRTNADLLKENVSNKSINVATDGTSDTKYSSVKSVKTYVDASATSGTTALTNEATIRANADITLQSNITTLGSTVTANASTAANATALKENSANKSTTVTLGTSDTLFPTQNAVKTYVDASATSGTTALTNEATIRANADITLQSNITTLGSTVTANASTAANATALKENSANKSTTVTLGTSDTLFPTQNAVKTYVDATVATATPDATPTVKGKVQLAGDLTGTAAVPTIAANAVTSAKILDGEIVNADVSATAAIADTKLATIATAGKVSNSATTATTANTPNTIVLRDASGNLSAGVITATGFSGPITGNVTGNVSGTAANVTGIVAIANGGTGSSTQNFVDLTTAQTVAGAKTFNADLIVNRITVGGGSAYFQNTIVGENALRVNTTGSNNTVMGMNSLFNNTTGASNTAIGMQSLYSNITGNGNTAIGLATLSSNNSGIQNSAFGAYALNGNTVGTNNTASGFFTLLSNTTGSNNTASGNKALLNNTTGSNNTAIGDNSGGGITTGSGNTLVGAKIGYYVALSANLTNNIILANGTGDIKAQNDGTNWTMQGNVTGASFIKSGGTSSQFLKADGSVDSTTYLTAAGTATNVSGIVAIANGGTGATTGAGALTNLGAAPTASPTFTGTVTAGPINAGALTANASISSEITANFTISNANSELYKGKVLICNPSSQITITFNSDLPTGFNCMVLQKSADANKINLLAGSGIVIKNRNNYTATAGNYAIATVVNIGGGIIVTAGDMQ